MFFGLLGPFGVKVKVAKSQVSFNRAVRGRDRLFVSLFCQFQLGVEGAVTCQIQIGGKQFRFGVESVFQVFDGCVQRYDSRITVS